MQWTKAQSGWTDHPKYKEAGLDVDDLDLPRPDGRRLVCMYMALIRDYATRYADDGNLTGKIRQLAIVLGLGRAEAQEVIDILVDVELLDFNDEDGELHIHGWKDTYESVYRNRKRVERQRGRRSRTARKSASSKGCESVPAAAGSVTAAAISAPAAASSVTAAAGMLRAAAGPDEMREEEKRLEKENYDGSKPVLTPARVGSETQDSTQPTPAKPTRSRKLGDSAADCAERLEQLPLDQKAVWDLWVELTGRTKAMRLTRKRAGKLRRQVEAHGVDGCLRGLAKLAASPHHSGENDAGKRYDDWHNKPLCDPGSFESWCEPPRAPAGPARASPVDYDQLADSAGVGFGSPVGESPGRSTANGDAA